MVVEERQDLALITFSLDVVSVRGAPLAVDSMRGAPDMELFWGGLVHPHLHFHQQKKGQAFVEGKLLGSESLC